MNGQPTCGHDAESVRMNFSPRNSWYTSRNRQMESQGRGTAGPEPHSAPPWQTTQGTAKIILIPFLFPLCHT